VPVHSSADAIVQRGHVEPERGQFSPFTLTFAREDREQDLSGIQVKMPPGSWFDQRGAMCGEAQANAGTCSSASRIGTMTSPPVPVGIRSMSRARST